MKLKYETKIYELRIQEIQYRIDYQKKKDDLELKLLTQKLMCQAVQAVMCNV